MKRREFMGAAAAGATFLPGMSGAGTGRPALLGGEKIRKERFLSWPVADEREEKAMQDVVRSRQWYRGNGQAVQRFEDAYAQLTGAKHCLATANGTSALIVSLASLGVGAGDEVIVPPYTFIATVNAVLMMNASPVFVDTDRETLQIDAGKIEAAITPRTAAIMPVHIGGSSVDLDRILSIAAKHKVPVIEDACQAHLAEWRGKKVGTLGTTGCFSFQASKNLNSGEGGAVLTNDEDLAERGFAFHNNCSGRKKLSSPESASRGTNLRMSEFQAAMLLSQMSRIEKYASIRTANAEYLSSLLREIPGIVPARMYDGCTRNAYHLYMFRYNQEAFGGLARAKFLKALSAEGIPASSGYTPLNTQPFLKNTFASRGFARIYPAEYVRQWNERNRCPENELLCKEAVWLTQNMLLGPRSDMDQIAAAVRKLHASSPELARA